ncbi:MAG: methionine gamma-lyase family protein, partial [Candidatus Eremiobacteraeota bacterium]|nr:methionine gamma-lyase family protein [Candidatus Eremiobacteraeota bacterium]
MNDLAQALGTAAEGFGFEASVSAAATAALDEVAGAWRKRDAAALQIGAKVTRCFRQARLTEAHLAGTTGYGYHDAGREAFESLLAATLGAQTAFVRLQLASGTHAIVAAVRALLGGDGRLVSLTGPPYDTLRMALTEPLQREDAIRYREAVWDHGSAPDAY